MSQRGFSLIELLVAMAVMIAVTAIAVPHLLRARMSANEAAAVGNVRLLQDAQLAYSIGHPDLGYSCSLSELGPLQGVAADLIDSQLMTGKKSGYVYDITACSESLPRTSYAITAAPEANGTTGKLYFCVRQDGVILYSANNSLNCVSHGIPLQQRAFQDRDSDLASASAPTSTQ
jgi:prepilin-type N-terminal cleavage/methylation domain-containing protein